jgi:hypothetical protein
VHLIFKKLFGLLIQNETPSTALNLGTWAVSMNNKKDSDTLRIMSKLNIPNKDQIFLLPILEVVWFGYDSHLHIAGRGAYFPSLILPALAPCSVKGGERLLFLWPLDLWILASGFQDLCCQSLVCWYHILKYSFSTFRDF